MNFLNTGSRITAIFLILIFLISCSNENKDIDKLKRENGALKKEMLEREKRETESEIESLRREKAELERKLEEQDLETDKSLSKTYGGTIEVSIEVDKYKPDGRKWDSTGAPDISGKIIFPDGSSIIIEKEQDSYTAKGMVENVTLRKNDLIEVFLEDRDFSKHDLIASGKLTFLGKRTFKANINSASLTFTLK